MSRIKTVAILFGGKSVEHKVSLRSAKNIYDNIDKSIVTLFGSNSCGVFYNSIFKSAIIGIEIAHPILHHWRHRQADITDCDIDIFDAVGTLGKFDLSHPDCG